VLPWAKLFNAFGVNACVFNTVSAAADAKGNPKIPVNPSNYYQFKFSLGSGVTALGSVVSDLPRTTWRIIVIFEPPIQGANLR